MPSSCSMKKRYKASVDRMFQLLTQKKIGQEWQAFKTDIQKKIQCIHTYLSNNLSVVMVNVFTSVWVERGLDSRFPVWSNLGLKQ